MIYPDFAELTKLYISAQLPNLSSGRVKTKLSGGYSSIFAGQGLSFDSVRPYVVGDDIRHVDWRVTARAQVPHIKTFEAESDRKIMIAVDMNEYMNFASRGTFKSVQAARAAAVIAGFGYKERDRVGAAVFAASNMFKIFPASHTRQSALEFLKFLSNPNLYNLPAEHKSPHSQKSSNLSESVSHTKHFSKYNTDKDSLNISWSITKLIQRTHNSSLLFLITDMRAILSVDPKKLSELQMTSDTIIIVVHDPIERKLPKVNKVRYSAKSFNLFPNHKTSLGMVENSINAGRITPEIAAKYTELWQEQRQNFIAIMQKYGIKYLELTTNEPVEQALRNGVF